jgi:ABC-2 type transport system ATP-binding protein
MNFQSPYVDLPRRLAVRQNLRVYAALYGVQDALARIETLATDLDFAGLIDQPSASSPRGSAQRIGRSCSSRARRVNAAH